MLIFGESPFAQGVFVSVRGRRSALNMFVRMVLAFVLHSGRMSCSAAAVACAQLPFIGAKSRAFWRRLAESMISTNACRLC